MFLAVAAVMVLAGFAWLLYSRFHQASHKSAAQQMSIERLTHDGKTNGATQRFARWQVRGLRSLQ